MLRQVVESDFLVEFNVTGCLDLEVAKCFMKVALRIGNTGMIDPRDT